MNAPLPEPVEPLIPARWAHATVSESLHCRRCGYDLRGLRADGRCPECGSEIWASVVHTVDPTASRLPSLRNPVAVGNSLLILTACTLVGAILLVVPDVAALIDLWTASPVRRWSARAPSLNWSLAMLLCVAGLWAVWLLAPPRGSEPHGAVWIDIWRIALGYAGWLVFSAVWAQAPRDSMQLQRLALHVVAGAFAIMGLIGMRGVFGIIGQRSRAYRQSQGGRQSLDLIIAAIVVGVLAGVGRYIGGFHFMLDWRYGVRTISTLIVGMSNLMVVIGLAYLVANSVWIRRSLLRPPPSLDQVLMPNVPRDTWIPDREE